MHDVQLSRRDADKVVRLLINSILQSLVEGNEVRIEGLGKLVPKLVRAAIKKGSFSEVPYIRKPKLEVYLEQFSKSRFALLRRSPINDQLQKEYEDVCREFQEKYPQGGYAIQRDDRSRKPSKKTRTSHSSTIESIPTNAGIPEQSQSDHRESIDPINSSLLIESKPTCQISTEQHLQIEAAEITVMND